LQQIEEGVAALARETNICVVTIEGSRERAEANPRAIPARRNEEQTDAKNDLQALHEEAIRALGRASITGSGFLIPGGFIVTTAEVTGQMRDPTVLFPDGTRMKPEWISADKTTNLSVLKIAGVPAERGLKWGDSDRVQQGHFAVTLGNQGGFANSISLGLISGKGRSGNVGEVRYRDLIQFQGTVGRGCSGGPLLNARGEVIGMIVATPGISLGFVASAENKEKKEKEQDGEENAVAGRSLFAMEVSSIGFAIPTNEMRRTVEALCRRQAPVARVGWLGISISDDMGEAARLELGNALRKTEAGEAIRILLLRNKKEMTLTVTSEPRPSAAVIKKTRIRQGSSN
jgi:S1-C subfamily serine protease